MRWRIFAFIRGKWKFVDAVDTESYARDLVREYIRAGYKAFTTNKQQMKRNPSGVDIRKGQRLYRAFTGKVAPEPKQINIPDMGKVGVVVGQLFEVRYISARDGKPYKHPFRVKSRPSLISTVDGKMVLIVGGRFAFTDRGFVDK